MKRALIATVDAAKARIYLYQEQTNPGFELTEIADLDNPNRTDLGAPASASDDNRDVPRHALDGRFAKLIAGELDDQVTRRRLGHLVLCAGPKMLGSLRGACGTLHRDGIVFEEIEKDLSNMSVAQLHDYLANAGIVPGRQRRVAAR